MNHTGQSVLLLLYCKCCLFSFLHIYGATTYNIGSLETWLNLRFKMFRLSSSSTFGLWLSLLRRNTKTTFWTIFDSSCLSPVLFILFKPAVVSSLCAFSRGIPYVSISHPNRGCGAWAEALPTSGITDEEPNSLSVLRILHQNLFPVFEMLHLRCSWRVAISSSGTPLYYPPQTTGAFQLGRDELLGCDSPCFPGYCMHNL